MKIHRVLQLVLVMQLSTGEMALAADETHSGQAAANALQSGAHASASVAHSIAASGQVTSAASAMPLAIGGALLGSAGAASMGAANDSARAAASPIGKPLTITDETITVMPPNEALKQKKTKPEEKPANAI